MAPVSISAVLFQVCFLLAGGVGMQDRQEKAEPGAINQFFFFVSAEDFKPLEQQTAAVPKSKSFLAVEGSRSTIRFVQGEPLVFVIRLSPESGDPADVVQLTKLKPQGNYRALERVAVPFEATMLEESTFKIKPKSGLGGGEYALSVVGKKDVYCFGVDAPSKSLK